MAAKKNSLEYWQHRIGEPICSYYDGCVGHLQDVRTGEDGDVEIKTVYDPRFPEAAEWRKWYWCSFDTDTERWIHPDRLE